MIYVVSLFFTEKFLLPTAQKNWIPWKKEKVIEHLTKSLISFQLLINITYFSIIVQLCYQKWSLHFLWMTCLFSLFVQNELEYIPEESPLRSMNSDHQPKNSSVFSNALSSPVRRTLQHYHLPQGVDNATPSLNMHRSTENGYRESNAPTSNDSSMDMQADSPAHKSSYWKASEHPFLNKETRIYEKGCTYIE